MGWHRPILLFIGSSRLISAFAGLSLVTCFILVAPTHAQSEPPFTLPPITEISKLRSAIIYTDLGEIKFELYPQIAPWHVANFKYLADKGFYKNLVFIRYEPGYYIQAGSPNNSLKGGPGYTLPAEFSNLKHTVGTLGMARLEDYINPERRSNGSQFHIMLRAAPFTDGDHTVFGQAISGLDVLAKLRKGDRIRDLKVFVRPDPSK